MDQKCFIIYFGSVKPLCRVLGLRAYTVVIYMHWLFVYRGTLSDAYHNFFFFSIYSLSQLYFFISLFSCFKFSSVHHIPKNHFFKLIWQRKTPKTPALVILTPSTWLLKTLIGLVLIFFTHAIATIVIWRLKNLKKPNSCFDLTLMLSCQTPPFRADSYKKGWVCFYYYPFDIGLTFPFSQLIADVLKTMNVFLENLYLLHGGH